MEANHYQTLRTLFAFIVSLVLSVPQTQASQAYGTISNFDVVNDTGHECHGFEIELEDCHSTDISYTYDYNHYGKCQITEDNPVALHPRTFIRWASTKNADGTWAAKTAVPAAPIAPTNGHQFTNPSVNFGGEHFGVGYRANPAKVTYFWLCDNGTGTLIRGPEVMVSTPVFNYYPAAVVGAAPQVQAVIPVPPEPAPVFEFGDPVWVKEIRTTTHNNNEIKLRELVSDDPDVPPVVDWRNGEPDEVETEWQLLQHDFNKGDGGANAELPAAPEDLNNGDEVVTRRYEFFKYTGPSDTETNEAMADNVAPDNEHGVGSKTINGVVVDLSTKIIVGEYLGAQMSAFDADATLALIDQVSDGRVGTVYAGRTVVQSGALPFTATRTGALPPGMSFNLVTGVLSGTPTTAGVYQFTINATDASPIEKEKNYSITILAANEAAMAQSSIDTIAEPLAGGSTTGDGPYANGANVTVTAVANAGYTFAGWMDNNALASETASFTFAASVNRSLIAMFVPEPKNIIATSMPAAGGSVTGDGPYDIGTDATLIATPSAGYAFANWTEGAAIVSSTASYTFPVTTDRTLVANFTVIGTSRIIATSSNPVAGGTITGAGTFADGSNVTVIATSNAGYTFTNWKEGAAIVSSTASYTFVATANRTLVANFNATGGGNFTIAASSSPLASGTVTGTGSFPSGTSITLNAINSAGYKFSKWTVSGVQVSTLNNYTFNVTANRTLVAVFVPALSIGVFASPPEGGVVAADSPSYEPGDGADVQADANPGYAFANWTENGVIVSTDWKYEFTINTSRTLVANFTSQGNVSITLSALPVGGGTVSGGGSKVIGAPVTAWAQEAPGYKFHHWSEGAATVSTDKDYQFIASANRTLVANYVLLPANGVHETENADEMEFEWPETASGWVLQESTDMVTWVNSTRAINISGGKKRARISKLNVPGVFFRLVKP